MSAILIPVNKLSAEALKGVINEFISRAGTDYGETEASAHASFRQVKQMLKSGQALLVFDDESETTQIFLKDNPLLKKMDQFNE